MVLSGNASLSETIEISFKWGGLSCLAASALLYFAGMYADWIFDYAAMRSIQGTLFWSFVALWLGWSIAASVLIWRSAKRDQTSESEIAKQKIRQLWRWGAVLAMIVLGISFVLGEISRYFSH